MRLGIVASDEELGKDRRMSPGMVSEGREAVHRLGGRN